MASLQQFMREGKITSLCERGVDNDLGRYRLTVFFGNRRLRLSVQRRSDKNASVELLRNLLKKQGFAPDVLAMTTCVAVAARATLVSASHEQGPRKNNRA